MGSEAVPKVGVVTVTYNSAEVLPDFFQSLWTQVHKNFLLYAVDNASSDATLGLLHRETDARLRIVVNSKNLGVAEGNNIGIRMALEDGCDSILLLNNDVVFPPQLMTELLNSIQKNNCEMVAPKMMYFQPANMIWWAGGHFQSIFGYRAVHDNINRLDNPSVNSPGQVTYVPTCCVLIDKTVFFRIGLMDAQYFVYFDDTDFMFRAWRDGVILRYEPSVVLFHKVSSLTKGTTSPFSTRLFTRNRVYFWRKHLGLPLATILTACLTAYYLLEVFLLRKPFSTLLIQMKAIKEARNCFDAWRLATGDRLEPTTLTRRPL